jgi:hypothetical protein
MGDGIAASGNPKLVASEVEELSDETAAFFVEYFLW